MRNLFKISVVLLLTTGSLCAQEFKKDMEFLVNFIVSHDKLELKANVKLSNCWACDKPSFIYDYYLLKDGSQYHLSTGEKDIFFLEGVLVSVNKSLELVMVSELYKKEVIHIEEDPLETISQLQEIEAPEIEYTKVPKGHQYVAWVNTDVDRVVITISEDKKTIYSYEIYYDEEVYKENSKVAVNYDISYTTSHSVDQDLNRFLSIDKKNQVVLSDAYANYEIKFLN